MTKTILFDLDNTLILFDETKFFRAYISKVAPIMADIVSPHMLWRLVLSSTKAVLHNNGELTNKEVFSGPLPGDLRIRPMKSGNVFSASTKMNLIS